MLGCGADGRSEVVGDCQAFPDALREAIHASGLTLTRIQDRLERRGKAVSPATLSYWQSGRSRPERESSMEVLSELESVLNLERGALARLLGAPRPRGRWTQRVQAIPGIDAIVLDERRHAVAKALAGMVTEGDSELTRLSLHDRLVVGPQGDDRTLTARQLLRAERDGVDRHVFMHVMDEAGQTLPAVRPLRHCSIGDLYEDPAGVVAVELLFDRSLGRGDTILLEYQLEHRAPYPPAKSFDRRVRLPVREYVLEVCFTPPKLPTAVWQYETTLESSEQHSVHAVEVGPSHCAHIVVLDAGLGAHGLGWSWDSPVQPSQTRSAAQSG